MMGGRLPITEGHYAFRADVWDGDGKSPAPVRAPVVIREPVDPIDAGLHAAAKAAIELNITPPDLRTPEQIAEVDMLSQQAALLASDANVALLRGESRI